MSKSKITPGPWRQYAFGGPQIDAVKDGHAVCTMWGDEKDPRDSIHANARLIAAAPDLFDACVAVFNAADMASSDQRAALEKVAFAIMKAEGRS
ncbi:hypothetical protein ACLBXM_17785 [Xanthobacteraceae bacterium A53D]